MTHSAHADPHDVGLVDGCPACAGAAERPMSSLDERMLRDLIARTLDNRFRNPTEVGARSDTEARAMANVVNALERVGRLAEVAPAEVHWYLVERWHVDLIAGESDYTRAESELRKRGFFDDDREGGRPDGH